MTSLIGVLIDEGLGPKGEAKVFVIMTAGMATDCHPLSCANLFRFWPSLTQPWVSRLRMRGPLPHCRIAIGSIGRPGDFKKAGAAAGAASTLGSLLPQKVAARNSGWGMG